MQLTIRAVGTNVQVLSHLLAKNPENVYERKQKGHLVRFFYRVFKENEVEATIFVTPDPIELSNSRTNSYDITHYINDREFAVSSIFCSFIRNALGTALNGQPKEEYAEWVPHPFDLYVEFGPVVSSLSDKQIQELFEPLGFSVDITYGETDYTANLKDRSTARFLSLRGMKTLQDTLRQLFILIPVMDNYKHYYIDEKEIEKLQRYGEGWLEEHPKREYIYRQSLRFKELYNAMEKTEPAQEAVKQEKKVRLNDLRYEKIISLVEQQEPKTVVDFGSGEGKLTVRLGFLPGVQEILAVEPSESASLQAIRRFEKANEKSGFVQPTPMWGSLFYYDERMKGRDVIILCEVIEHIDEHRLPKAVETILHEYQPKTFIVTTPNREYNEVYNMNEALRHTDHRFEWTRTEFERWCQERNKDQAYKLQFDGAGEEHEQYGFPTQICVFTRKEEER
ncbi:3' terminal RNA ribose 2'-O-methyltransferase Hen1 [Domibacillus iocasae]|uniref:Small RNA 2'-O-methyltransferase n=1 Tax=Domibacillus iocasae TaxID=1714016 RepID=A0A1E7DRQ5_9BACI|nr:3' terminal RNA ribose 2'-O-methyltransferase Hen1 [Domibacillus iocasae]OES45764.1 3' terminal RNA ribose 2'-O-methyltransferase Hen1 [Domibacillus iocasae]